MKWFSSFPCDIKFLPINLMQKNPRYLLSAFTICLIVSLLTGCKVISTVISRDDMPSSENAFFTESGRLFVASGNSLYEVAEDSSNTSIYILRLELAGHFDGVDCTFSGLTAQGEILYTACVEEGGVLGIGKMSFFVRVDLNNDYSVDYIPFPEELDGVYPNGMAVDAAGDIYVSNSTSLLMTETAVIYRLNITEDFMVSFTPWLEREQVELFPNGIQIQDNYLYFVNGPSFKRIEMTENGPGEIIELYKMGAFGYVDDFILANDKAYLARLGLPIPPVDYQAIMVISIAPDSLGNREKNIKLDQGTIPSSVVYAPEQSGFKKGALLVTDFFNGGLFQITGY